MNNKRSKNSQDVLKAFPVEKLAKDKFGMPLYITSCGLRKDAVPVKSKLFENYVRRYIFENGLSLLEKDVKDIVGEISGHAYFSDKEPIETSIRSCHCSETGAVIYDLADKAGTLVEISKGEVKFVNDPLAFTNVFFRHPETMLAMKMPMVTKTWSKTLFKLKSYVNADSTTFMLFLAYLSFVIAHPKSKGIPYPALIIQGMQGSGKSFLCNYVLRALLDPNSNASLRMPNRDQDWAIQLTHTFLGVYDNIRSFTPKESDLLCQIVTMCSFVIRQHQSYEEIASMIMHSPLVLNGIFNFVDQPDLADRSLRIQLQPMQQESRKTEIQLKTEFNELLPELLGSLFMLSAKALEVLDTCETKYPARLMDFSLWLAANEKVFGLTEGKLQKAYLKNVKSIMAVSLEDDGLMHGLKELLNELGDGQWRYTSTSLLEALDASNSADSLPKSASGLTKRLKEIKTSLSANDIYFEIGRDAERFIIISSSKLPA